MKNTSYRHLTESDRIRLEVLLCEGQTQIDIARALCVNRSTICRELKNRGMPKHYLGRFAQVNYEQKREKCRPKRKIEETSIGSYVIGRIKAGWSPETISGRIDLEIEKGLRPISDQIVCETIYKFIYESQYGKQENIYQYLRRGKRRRTKQHGRKSQKQTIPNRVFIDLRPKEVDERKEIGHWEGDTIHYAYKQGINSLVERKARFVELTKLERRTADETEKAVTNKLEHQVKKSLTLDNGLENYRHESIAAKLQISVFFCHAYHSWEKGTNENMNGIVRRYLPKRSSLKNVTQQDLDDIAEELNDRPRKILDYQTPKEVLLFEMKKLTNCCT